MIETGMKRAVVTGGGGFIGRALVQELVSRGVETGIVGRHRYPQVEKMGALSFCGDIRDEGFLKGAFKGFDTVFHVAAKAGIWGPWREYFSINVIGTENVLSACLANRINTLVYTSTPSVVFGNHDLCGADEKTPYATRFLCHYAHTKVLAEKMILAANDKALKTTALRPHLVWGPEDNNLIPRLLERGRRRLLKQVGNGDNLVSISYIDNVVDAHILAAKNLKTVGTAAGQAYFISNKEPVNLWDWINGLFDRLSIPRVERRVSFRKAYLAGMILEIVYRCLGTEKEPLMTRFLAAQLARSHWFSIAKAQGQLGYVPEISIAQGMDRLIGWLDRSKKGNGFL